MGLARDFPKRLARGVVARGVVARLPLEWVTACVHRVMLWLAARHAPDPAAARYAYAKGDAALTQGQWEDAFRACEIATAADPDWPDAYLLLGYVAAHLGRWDAGRKALERAAQLDGRNPLPLVYRGDLELGARSHAAAEAAFREALRRQPDSTAAWKKLGVALDQQGRIVEAIAALERAQRLAPLDPSILLGLGIALCRAERWDDALEVLEPAVAAQLQSAVAHYYLASALAQRGQWRRAKAHAQAALTLDPGDARLEELAAFANERVA